MRISKRAAAWLLPQLLFVLFSCSGNPAGENSGGHEEPEPEAIARTEFTDRIENFFEYEPLHAGHPSQVRIHLTDLTDGSPVAQAEVTLMVRRAGSREDTLQTVAKVGKVTGIYVAELTIPQPGDYDIEFHVKSSKIDERLPLSGFRVEQP